MYNCSVNEFVAMYNCSVGMNLSRIRTIRIAGVSLSTGGVSALYPLCGSGPGVRATFSQS